MWLFGENVWEYQTCPDCGYWGSILTDSKKHVTICLYVAQPWMNNIRIRCPECGHKQRIFALKRGAYRRLLKAKARRVGKKFAPDKVIKDFEEYFGVNAVKPKELNAREEKLLAYYRTVLDKGHTE